MKLRGIILSFNLQLQTEPNKIWECSISTQGRKENKSETENKSQANEIDNPKGNKGCINSCVCV